MKQRHNLIIALVAAGIFSALWAILVHAHSSENRRIVALVEALDSPDAGVREQSEGELRRLGTNVVPAIVGMLYLPHPFFQANRQRLAEALELLSIHLQPGEYRRLRALKACVVLGPLAEGATPALSRLLVREPSPLMAIALASIGEGLIPAVSCLLTNRNDDTSLFSLACIETHL